MYTFLSNKLAAFLLTSDLLKMVKAYKIKDELNFTLLGTQFWYVNDIMINGMDSGDV